jgi:Fe-S cluster assembly scaffold protein SufB
MKRIVQSILLVFAGLLCGCEARTSGLVAGASQQTSASQSARDTERQKADDKVAAQARREHPDWSEKQISDYVKGYNGIGAISPEVYAKTRAVLDAARSLRCQFPRGAYVNLADPGLGRHEAAGAEVTFDAIDRQAGRTRIVAKSGAADVKVITGPTALTFIEIAATGNPLVTVVFPRFRAGTREFYAADSEHLFAFGDISIGQYYGGCTVLE